MLIMSQLKSIVLSYFSLTDYAHMLKTAINLVTESSKANITISWEPAVDSWGGMIWPERAAAETCHA